MADNDPTVSGPNNPQEDATAKDVVNGTAQPDHSNAEVRVMAVNAGPNNPQEDIQSA